MPTMSSSCNALPRWRLTALRVKENSSRRWLISTMATFSATVMEGKVAVIWKVRPTPRRQICAGLRPTSSSPASFTLPLSGRIWPFSMLKQVLLPAPLGPISASSSPSPTSKLTSFTACTPPKALLSPLTARPASVEAFPAGFMTADPSRKPPNRAPRARPPASGIGRGSGAPPRRAPGGTAAPGRRWRGRPGGASTRR